jgi:uncharacterized membrane protein YqaE (UPF0057 family)
MKTTMKAVTVILLVTITLWHLWCSLFAVYIAMMGKQPWMLALLVVILFPPVVLIRWWMRSKIATLDLILTVLAVLPGLILGLQEVARPRSPNVPWLVPLLIVYLLAPSLVAYLRFTSYPAVPELFGSRSKKYKAQQDAPSNGGQRSNLNSGFPPRRG